jgi:DNA-binding NarL/FixJ family response regulator
VIRVVVVDDHPVVREGLARYLGRDPELSVEASLGTAAELLRSLHTHPDVVLLDMHLPDMAGPEAVKAALREAPGTRVLALSSFAEPDLVEAAFAAGVSGYLMKDVEPQALRLALKSVAGGGTVVPPEIRSIREQAARSRQLAAVLSPREREVLELMGQGLSNREIGVRLYISEKTVKTHVSHILAKLDVTDRTGAILEGIRRQLIAIRDPRPNP